MKILYQNGPFWVCAAAKGFEVYKNAGTAADRCASIGFEGPQGLARAIKEADQRIAAETAVSVINAELEAGRNVTVPGVLGRGAILWAKCDRLKASGSGARIVRYGKVGAYYFATNIEGAAGLIGSRAKVA